MRWAEVVAAIVLGVAISLWWHLRETVQPTLPTAVGVSRLQAQQAAVVAKPAASGAAGTWTQNEQDRAWCRLPGVHFPEDRAYTAEELEQALGNNLATQQGRAEMARLRGLWAGELRQRPDERSQAAADMVEKSEASKRHLFSLARNTRDPVVYGWAMAECIEQSACELSPLRWAQLDPGNMTPWRLEAQRAQASGEEQAQREAFYQMGLARRSDDYARILFALEYSLARADRPGLQMSTEVFMPQTDYILRKMSSIGAGRYCDLESQKADPARRPLCEVAAESMWRNADDLMSASHATSWGKGATTQDDPVWTRRRAELENLRKRLMEHSDRVIAPFQESADQCGALPVVRKYLETVSAIGELAAIRQLPDTPPP